jgi:hypothetical protein
MENTTAFIGKIYQIFKKLWITQADKRRIQAYMQASVSFGMIPAFQLGYKRCNAIETGFCVIFEGGKFDGLFGKKLL